tara:strand:+ start:605 stop:1510 length:906 start_codon:yes stop_codon:yes gene_type:complete
MNFSIDGCTEIYTNSNSRELYNKYVDYRKYNTKTSFNKFKENTNFKTTTRYGYDRETVEGTLKVVQNNIHLEFPHCGSIATEIIEIPNDIKLGGNIDFTYYGVNTTSSCGYFLYKLNQLHNNGKIQYVINKIYCRYTINKDLYNSIRDFEYKISFEYLPVENDFHLVNFPSYTTMPNGEKVRTLVSIDNSSMVTLIFEHEGRMVDERLILGRLFDPFRRYNEYGNNKSLCGNFVWKFEVIKINDIIKVNIVKKYFKKPRKEKKRKENTEQNLIQSGTRERKKPKRMIPDFISPSNSRYNSL